MALYYNSADYCGVNIIPAPAKQSSSSTIFCYSSVPHYFIPNLQLILPNRNIKFGAKYHFVVFGNSLTTEQEQNLTKKRKNLKILSQDSYVPHKAALKWTYVTSLSDRRAAHLLKFSQCTARHPEHGPTMFPLNPNIRELHSFVTWQPFIQAPSNIGHQTIIVWFYIHYVSIRIISLVNVCAFTVSPLSWVN